MTEDKLTKYQDKPHSFETGKAGNRWKLYFNTPEELKAMIESLQAQGFFVGDEENGI